MENKNLNIDQILLSKSYNELSKEELNIIADTINTESVFNDYKAMLIAATKELHSAEEIEPKKETKAFLMTEFTKAYPANQTNAGGLGFLFPKGRAFYQKPGYQLIAIAAVLVLVFTIFPSIDGNMTSDEDVAQHQIEEPTSTAEQKEITSEEGASGDNSKEDETDKEVLVETTEVIAGNEQTPPVELEKELVYVTSDEKGYAKDGAVTYDSPMDDMEKMNEEEEEYVATISNNETVNGGSASSIAKESDADDNVSTGSNEGLSDIVNNNPDVAMDASVIEESNEIAILSEMKNEEAEAVSIENTSGKIQKARVDKKKDIAPSSIKTVKSLAENAELIDLFYTAM